MDIRKLVMQLRDDLSSVIADEGDLVERRAPVNDFVKVKRAATVRRIRAGLKRLSEKLPEYSSLLDKTDPQVVLESLETIEMPAQAGLPPLPYEIRDEVHADFAELNRCLDASCFRSAIILCARILETALHRKYFETTGKDLLEKAPGIGLGNVIAKLVAEGVELDPALTNQIHLINQVRIHAVHKKKAVFQPSEQQARAIVMYTTDVLRQLF
ncbi:DUF4145 domain-containing protein [Candidatus Woesearchaeota archaeon]|nr:DUF4145 domain-containing protein [Candidatus Woesearchaeota archaeon]